MTDSTAKTNVDRIQKMMLNGQKKIWNYIYFITTTYNFIGMKTGRDHPKRDYIYSYQSWKSILKILLIKQKLLNLQNISDEGQQ